MIAQQCELGVRLGAREHGRSDAEAERGVIFQSRSNAADSSMNRGVIFQNLSVELAEQSASIEK